MKSTFKFKVDIYGAYVSVIFTDTDQKGLKNLLKSLYKKFDENHEEDGAYDGCVFCPDADPYQYFVIFNTNVLSHGLISHEIEHLKNNMLDSFDYKMNTPDDELPANLTELIISKIYSYIKKKGMKVI